MSYSVSLAILLAFSIVLLCFLSFRWGVRFGKDPAEAAERSAKPNFPHKKRKEDPETDKTRRVLENIENYVGDGSNQRKI
ncbi:MAG: hypothetical protein HFE75_05125 [Firmicutes bacterium]|jgi:hypothetical protein|nr:hypothetical protein [Bacillota bacterium]